MTIYSLDVLLFLFGTSLLFHVQFLTVASWPAYRFLKWQVRWSGIPISFRIFQFIVIHKVEDFGVINKAEIDVFLLTVAFLMIQQILAIWSLVPLPFLKSAWTFGSSQFMYCWFFMYVKFSIHAPSLENFEHYC